MTGAVGVDLGGTNVKLVSLRGRRVLDRAHHPTPAGTASEIAATLAALIRGASSRIGGLPAVAVAVPGFLDRRRRRIELLSNVPALDGFALAASLERRLRGAVTPPIRLDADTNAGALGEARLGAGRGASRLLYVTVGTGLGAALITDGRIVRVSRHTVGQVAHIPLDPAGPRCPCGARGCAEQLIAARGITARARRLALAARDRRSPADVLAAARRSSRAARAVLRETGVLLGRLLSILTAMLSPDRVVVGGGVAGAAEFLLPATRRELRDRVEVRPAALGRFSGAVGAAIIATTAATE